MYLVGLNTALQPVPGLVTVMRRCLLHTPRFHLVQRTSWHHASCRGREDGTISSADLEKLLTRHGDAIERDSYSQFLQFCGVESHLPTDRIDYAPLVDTLTCTWLVALVSVCGQRVNNLHDTCAPNAGALLRGCCNDVLS